MVADYLHFSTAQKTLTHEHIMSSDFPLMDHKINRIYEQNICPTINRYEKQFRTHFRLQSIFPLFHGYSNKLRLFIYKIINSVLTCHPHMFDMLYKSFTQILSSFQCALQTTYIWYNSLRLSLFPQTIEAIPVDSSTYVVCVFF